MVINVLEQWSSTGIQRNTKLPLVSARGAGQMLDLHIIYCESYSYLICLQLVFNKGSANFLIKKRLPLIKKWNTLF